jgi:rhodanese-related sulfurtransferase
MPVKRISPDEAEALVNEQGYSYLDVRSVAEFEGGHPKGAFNIPIADMGPRGMAPNLEFLTVVQKVFPKDSKLVVGCMSGGRSLQAVTLLLSSGYAHVVDQRAGFRGGMDPQGRPEPGWGPRGLPSATTAEPGHSYAELKAK